MRDEPTNLSRLARLDLNAIIEQTIDRFGEEFSRTTADRILGRCLSIQEGHTVGHRIDYIRRRRPILYHYEQPWMIAFRPKSREIIRIVHGRRNLARLIP